jgi:hypothetical protein
MSNHNPFATKKHKTPIVSSSKKRQINLTNDKNLDGFDDGMKFKTIEISPRGKSEYDTQPYDLRRGKNRS